MGSSWPRLAVEHRAVGRTVQPLGSSPGLYKLWLEAQWNGCVVIFPFVRRIAAPREVSSLRPIPNEQIISASAKGFSPQRMVAAATLRWDREDAAGEGLGR